LHPVEDTWECFPAGPAQTTPFPSTLPSIPPSLLQDFVHAALRAVLFSPLLSYHFVPALRSYVRGELRRQPLPPQSQRVFFVRSLGGMACNVEEGEKKPRSPEGQRKIYIKMTPFERSEKKRYLIKKKKVVTAPKIIRRWTTRSTFNSRPRSYIETPLTMSIPPAPCPPFCPPHSSYVHTYG